MNGIISVIIWSTGYGQSIQVKQKSSPWCLLNVEVLNYIRILNFNIIYHLLCSDLIWSVLIWSVLICSDLFCSILLYSVLFCSVMFDSIIFCYVMLCYVMLCSVLFCSVRFYYIQVRLIRLQWLTGGFALCNRNIPRTSSKSCFTPSIKATVKKNKSEDIQWRTAMW